jgi:hypothetical protein
MACKSFLLECNNKTAVPVGKHKVSRGQLTVNSLTCSQSAELNFLREVSHIPGIFAVGKD